jgi:hypothetical protein
VFKGSRSSGIKGREYDIVSGGELRTLLSAFGDATTNPAIAKVTIAVPVIRVSIASPPHEFLFYG